MEAIRRRIRALYFAVPDMEARRLLIAETRQLESLHKAEAWDKERRAERAVGAAMESSAHEGGYLAIEFAAFAVATWLEGWSAGVVASLLAWAFLKPAAEKARQATIEQAERDADLIREGRPRRWPGSRLSWNSRSTRESTKRVGAGPPDTAVRQPDASTGFRRVLTSGPATLAP